MVRELLPSALLVCRAYLVERLPKLERVCAILPWLLIFRVRSILRWLVRCPSIEQRSVLSSSLELGRPSLKRTTGLSLSPGLHRTSRPNLVGAGILLAAIRLPAS